MKDYLKSQQDMSKALMSGAINPQARATPLSGLSRLATALMAYRNQNQTGQGLEQIKQGEKDQSQLDIARALGAARGDTPYQPDPSMVSGFEGDQLPTGLKNQGTGNDMQAFAAALAGSTVPSLQKVGLTGMMTAPKATGTNQQQNFNEAVKNGYSGSFMDFMKDTKGGVTVSVGGMKTPPNMYPSPDFNPEKPISDSNQPFKYIPGTKAEKDARSGTAEMTASATFATRMTEDEKVFGVMETSGYDPANFIDALASGSGKFGNYFISDKGKRYYQAASDWVRAKLRKESGAAIGETEMLNEIRNYFPMPGDDKATIEQKKRSRYIATNGMIDQSQGHYKGSKYELPDIEAVAPAQPEINPDNYIFKDGKWYERGN